MADDLPLTHVDARGFPLLWSWWRNRRSGIDSQVVGRHPYKGDYGRWLVRYRAETPSGSFNQCHVEYFKERYIPVMVTDG